MPGIRQARKYAMWERGELLPSQEPNSMMRCSCGERFDSHDPASNHVHLPHTMRPKRLTGYGAAKVHAPQALLKTDPPLILDLANRTDAASRLVGCFSIA
jgi:hypothetical protein